VTGRNLVPLGIPLLACGLWAQDVRPVPAADKKKTAKKEVARLIDFAKVDRTLEKVPTSWPRCSMSMATARSRATAPS
jgi:hypothetical protein